MRIQPTEQIEAKPVNMDGAEGVTMRLLIGREHGAPNFAMRQFTVRPGGHTPRHRHNYEHEVYILDGKGVVHCQGQDHAIAAGHVLLVPDNAEHQFTAARDEGLTFLCLVPVQFNGDDCSTRPTPGS